MVSTPLRSIVNANFVTVIDKLGTSSGGSSGQALVQKLQGGAQTTSLDVALRTGARNFALGVQALNRGIAFVNVSYAAHERLANIADRLGSIAEKAAKGGIGTQEGTRLVQEFRQLARDFQTSTLEAEVEGTDLLDPDDMGAILVSSGLDPETSDALGGIFKKLKSLTETKVDATGNSTKAAALIPTEQFAQSVRQTAGEFDDAAAEAEPVSAAFTKIREDLSKVREQIGQNMDALNKTRDLVAENMVLVRAAGRAFLSLSEQITGTEKADDVARKIREQIRRDAPQALEHAGNLESIVVAGLTLTAKAVAKK